MKNQKKPFFILLQAVRDIERNIEKTAALIREVIPVWQFLSDQPLTIELLQEFTAGGQVATEKIELMLKRELAAKANLTSPYFDQGKVLDLMKTPDMGALMDLLDQFSRIMGPGFRFTVYWNCFAIDGDQVKILPDQVEQIKDSFRSYADTPEEADRLTLARGIIDGMDRLRAKFPDIPAARFVIIGLVTEQEGQLMPSEVFVKHGTFEGGNIGKKLI